MLHLLTSVLAVRAPPRSISRRHALAAGAAFAATGGVRHASAFERERAVDVAFAGASCGVQSCVDAGLAELATLLDTAGVSKSKAMPKTTPVISVEPIKTGPQPAFSVLFTADHPMEPDDSVQIMWLRDAATGKILSVKPFGRPRCKPLIVGGECIPDRAPPTLVAVVRAEAGTRIVPALYSTTGGLVEGTPFTLCDADGAACDAAGKLRLTRPIDSRIKRPSADVGRDVLAQR